MTLIATVLRSGGDFTTEYVERLRDAFGAYDFVCLSDIPVPCDRIPLATSLPGWWAKLELFRLPGPVFYVDLDTIIAGNVRDIVDYPHTFTVLRDFNDPTLLATGMMAWKGEYSWLLTKYRQIVHDARGDASWLQQFANRRELSVDFFQDLFPHRITSYKLDPDTAGADIVCYHGKPRPHETGWAC